MKKWKDKSIFIDNNRNVSAEMALCGLKMEDVISILDEGSQVKKRKKRIIEKWLQCGNRIRIAVVEDCNEYWLLRHVGEIKATRRKLKLLRGDK